MSRGTAAGVGACTLLACAVAAYAIVGGLPGLLYAGGVVMAGAFLALKLGLVPSLTGPPEDRWRRKSVVIAELRVELADRERELAELHDRLEREGEEARVRIRELESDRDGRQALLDDERRRFEQFLGELTGGIGQRGDELAALERELAALVGA
jgi:hypothetical protein